MVRLSGSVKLYGPPAAGLGDGVRCSWPLTISLPSFPAAHSARLAWHSASWAA